MKDFQFLFSLTALLEAWEQRLQLELVRIEQPQTESTDSTVDSPQGFEPF